MTNAFLSKNSSLTPRQQTSYEPKLNNLLNSTTRNNYTKLIPNRLSISESSSNPSTNSTNLPKFKEPILPKCSSLIDSFYSRKGFKSNRLITIMELMDNKRNILQKKSSLLLLIRKYHKFCGYLTVVLCKINIYIITWGGDFAGFFAFDLISACMLVFWKLRFPRIEAKPPSFKFQSIPRSIASISELNQGKDYIVFSNFVYEV